MRQDLSKIQEVVEYPDYKKFVRFVANEYKILLSNINPMQFFRVDMNTSITNNALLDYSRRLFRGRKVEIPIFNNSKTEFNIFRRFEDFTAVNEVKNISLWSLSCLDFLSDKKSNRQGKELEIFQTGNPRDGRLDVVSFDNGEILILEAKVSLPILLREGRYKIQIPLYLKEANRIVNEHNKNKDDRLKVSLFLIIGGEESDVYPPDSPDCTSGKVGDISQIFYDNIVENNIKFISANALWALSAKSMIENKPILWRNILPRLFNESNTLGLVTGGKIVRKNDHLSVKGLEL